MAATFVLNFTEHDKCVVHIAKIMIQKSLIPPTILIGGIRRRHDWTLIAAEALPAFQAIPGDVESRHEYRGWYQ